ncbi:MAG: dTDP-4-dehydrorhamnose 3,5-epimerase [bacterium]
MIFRETGLAGAWLVEVEPHTDERGQFSRIWCRREFGERGLATDLVQASLSWNRRRRILRGMHYQAAPFEEVKLVRCVRGAVHDVIIDLRPDSPSFLEHFAVDLTADNRRSVYVPEGFAHGFQVLDDGSEVLYHMSEFYSPDHGRGVRWDDPTFGIDWPIADPILNERDRSYPDFRERKG